jgi:F-actin capping protein, beta subunit
MYVTVHAPSDEQTGSYDGIHVFEATERGRQAHYKLTSTVMLHLVRKDNKLGHVELGGSMTRQVRLTNLVRGSEPRQVTNPFLLPGRAGRTAGC